MAFPHKHKQGGGHRFKGFAGLNLKSKCCNPESLPIALARVVDPCAPNEFPLPETHDIESIEFPTDALQPLQSLQTGHVTGKRCTLGSTSGGLSGESIHSRTP